MRWVDGQTGRRADRRTGRRVDEGREAERRTGERVQGGGQAEERMGAGTLGGRAKGGGQGRGNAQMGGRAGWQTSGQRRMVADGRTGGQVDRGGWWWTDFRRVKLLNLTSQLIWLSEIQCGRPQITVQLRHLPPPSR